MAGAGRTASRTLAGSVGIVALVFAALAAAPASSEEAGGHVAGLTLEVPADTVPFGHPARVEVAVPDRTVGGPGSVTFLVDGERVAGPVQVDDGTASARLGGLDPGENTVTAVYDSVRGDRARASETVSVDSAAPGPEGILPCADRSVVLTMAYRSGDRVKFEGVAKYSLRGKTVRIRTGGRVVATALVGSDGTYWTSMRDPRRELGGRTEFIATIGGAESWSRRLGQAVTVTGRSPDGASRSDSRITVRGMLRSTGVRRVVLAKQVGCSKQKVMAIHQIGSARSGAFSIGITRPDRAEPYAIYRLLAGSGEQVSPPIVVRSLG